MTAPPREGSPRLFVAVWPDEATRRLLRGLEHELGRTRGLRFVGASRWHVTLRFLGGTAEPERIGAALREGCAAFPGPVECRLGPGTEWFTGVRVLHVPAAGLDALAAAVRDATSPYVPLPDDEPPFNGHLTLARSRGRRLTVAALGEMSNLPFDAAFRVDHVDLVASEPGPRGHLYTTLTRASLGAEPRDGGPA